MPPSPALRTLVDLRDRTLQKSRIAFGLRGGALERGADVADPATLELFQRWEARFDELETECDKDIEALVEDMPIVIHLTRLKGIGPMLAAKMVSLIDIEQADTVSALWRFAGLAVINGERERPTKGEKLHYSIRLKTTLYLVATSFMRSNSPYRALYDESREHYLATHADWTKGHQHLASMRRMEKVFLAHFWERWRLLEELPIRKLYVQEQLGHTHMLDPKDFGWGES